MRALADVRLPLQGLTVLIGDNGAGKSTLVEAFEILRKVGNGRMDIARWINDEHGGLATLLRLNSPLVSFGATVAADGETFEYDFALGRSDNYVVVEQETLVRATEAEGRRELFRRKNRECWLEDRPSNESAASNVLALCRCVPDVHRRFMSALAAIDVRVPFDTRPLWLCRERQWPAPLRRPAPPENVTSLARLGDNLTAAYHSLKENADRDEWEETVRLVRLGLGDDFVDVRFPPAGRGEIDLVLESRRLGPITTAALSDGQLTYLAMVAMARLPGERSVLAFDEPDLHLHPELLMRVLDLLEGISERHPVVLTTHSDRLLDALSEPDKSAVLCQLDDTRATELLRPDAKALSEWLKGYRGLGALREKGATSYVMTRKGNE